MAKVKKEDVLEYLESANMLEVSELISDIEEKFGVSAAAPVAVAAAPSGGGEAGASEEKSDFNVIDFNSLPNLSSLNSLNAIELFWLVPL